MSQAGIASKRRSSSAKPTTPSGMRRPRRRLRAAAAFELPAGRRPGIHVSESAAAECRIDAENRSDRPRNRRTTGEDARRRVDDEHHRLRSEKGRSQCHSCIRCSARHREAARRLYSSSSAYGGSSSPSSIRGSISTSVSSSRSSNRSRSGRFCCSARQIVIVFVRHHRSYGQRVTRRGRLVGCWKKIGQAAPRPTRLLRAVPRNGPSDMKHHAPA